MSRRDISSRTIRIIAGFAVGWWVCFVESMLCETAYGGPFTILASLVIKFFFTSFAVGAALLLGRVFVIPGIHYFWWRIGYWRLTLSVAPVCLMIFATQLELRTVEPISRYRMMPFWIWSTCLFLIVFPIVNWPRSPEHNA
jgi:hypothetical protein